MSQLITDFTIQTQNIKCQPLNSPITQSSVRLTSLLLCTILACCILSGQIKGNTVPIPAIWHRSSLELCHYLDTGIVWLKNHFLVNILYIASRISVRQSNRICSRVNGSKMKLLFIAFSFLEIANCQEAPQPRQGTVFIMLVTILTQNKPILKVLVTISEISDQYITEERILEQYKFVNMYMMVQCQLNGDTFQAVVLGQEELLDWPAGN